MLTLISFLGIVLLIATAILFFVKGLVRETDEQPDPSLHRYQPRKLRSPEWLILVTRTKNLIAIAGVAILLSLSNWLFYYSSFGHQYYLVYPTGGWSTEYNSGLKLRMFATIQEWQKEIDIKVLNANETEDGIEGVIRDKTIFQMNGKAFEVAGIHAMFIDRVNAAVRLSVRAKMPSDPEAFHSLAESFRSQQNLIDNTLIPTIREQVSNTGYQFACQDYISGAATDFRQALDDQLKNGGYSTVRQEYNDTIWSNIQDNGPRIIKEITTHYRIYRNVDKHGRVIRIPHDITKNSIGITQVIVDAVDPEPAFSQRLEAQRDISAQKRIEMEKIETAKAEQQRIAAEGERDKIKERMEQEKEQVKTLIAIETKLKQESTKKQLAEIALQTARLESEQNLVRERAQAEANRLKVAAGLTPQERAQYEKETAIGVAEKLSAMKFPQIYIQGQDGGKDGLLTSLLGAELGKKLLEKE